MKPHYPILLSPIERRGFVLKNRMLSASSFPHFHQGPEEFPAESIFAHFIERAKNGAAVVTISSVNDIFGMPELPATFDVAHFPHYNIYDAQCQNYIAQLFDCLHYYNSLASVGLISSASIFPYFREDGTLELVDVGSNADKTMLVNDVGRITDDIPKASLQKVAASFAQQCAELKRLGADMITLHMCYRGQFCGQFLSPHTNLRTDEFGGSAENRCRFPLMVLRAIREAVGEHFLIEVELSAEEENGSTIEDTLCFLRAAAPYMDIAQVRAGDIGSSLPTSFFPAKNPTLPLAEKIKRSDVDVLVCAIGGFLDPDDAEAALRDGKADLIGYARAFISNPDYGELVLSGRSDDIVPCLRCNKCHGRSQRDAMLSVCSVNPLFGIEHNRKYLENPAKEAKCVAVVGGGPGGMRAAIYLADRGHRVSLFEQTGELGGLLRHADFVDFKWTLQDYRQYLIRQVEKRDIDVRLHTRATPETLGDRYDVVIAAVGSEAKRPPIPGADGASVLSAVEAIMQPERVSGRVVVIGGGEVGTEVGIHLARKGHRVTVLSHRDGLACDSAPIHYREQMQEVWEAEENFSFQTRVSAEAVEDGCVVYRDADGARRRIEVDTVVYAVGQQARREEALRFYPCAERFYMVGDCQSPGSIQSVNRSAFAAASVI